MKITDLEGREITVTDLEEALTVTKEYIGYRHTDNEYAAFDKDRKAYWEDILKKLQQLKEQKTN